MKGNKEFTPIYILDYLRNNTDEDHPETFREIEEMLRYDYGLDYSRQTVAAKINNMIEDGLIEWAGPKKGVYFGDRDFDDSELMLLIYSVLSNKSISPAQADKLVARLSELGGSFFDISGLSIVGKGDAVSGDGNQELFLNLETVHDAIRNSRQLEFDYCRYGIDKKLNKYAHYIVSPYYVAMKNQKLYLLSGTEEDSKLRFFRVEHMKNAGTVMKKAVDISKMTGYEEGIDINRHISSLPYMFSDKPEEITFRAEASILNQIIDWFGKEIIVKEDPDKPDKILASIRTSPMAMKYWALQYLDSVEILSPQKLRDDISVILFLNKNKYKKDNAGGRIIRFKLKDPEKNTPASESAVLKKSHEYEDPDLRQLKYYFDTKPSDLIMAMYNHTEATGILNAPVHPSDRPVSSLGKKLLRCKMNWDLPKVTDLSKEFNTIYDALSELSELHAEIDVLDLESRVSPKALKTWNIFFKDYDFGEHEKELEKRMTHLIETEKNPERFASGEDEGYRRMPQDERFIFFLDYQILKDIRTKMKKRYNEEGRFLDELFFRVRRLYLLMAYKASDNLIEIEARRVARYMALSKHCETYDWSYLSD